MKSAIVIMIAVALGLAACSSDDEAPAAGSDAPSGGSSVPAAASTDPTPTPRKQTQQLVTNQQARTTCEWFTELIDDVNVGLISGVQGDVVSVGETRYRIKNMYAMSIGSSEPIHPAVKRLMAKTELKFEFEGVRPEIDALRDACELNGYPVPELDAQEEM